MRKVLVLAALVLLLTCSVCYAVGIVEEVFPAGTSVAAENTITSRVFRVKSGGYFGCWIHAKLLTTGAGGPGYGKSNLNIWTEMSYTADDDTFAKAYGTTYDVASFTTTTPTVLSLNPVPMPYMRIRVSGVKDGIDTGNTTGTTITMYLFTQED